VKNLLNSGKGVVPGNPILVCASAATTNERENKLRRLISTLVIAVSLALVFAGSAFAKTPYIACGLINPGAPEVTWQGDTAIAGHTGWGVSCDQPLIYYQWNGGPIGTTNTTFQASPGQSGTLDEYVGSQNYNYCDPNNGLSCPIHQQITWTDPNGTGGCTVNCGGGGGGGSPPVISAFSSNTPVASGGSTILYYTETGCATMTITPGSTFTVSGNGSFTYNAGAKADGTQSYSAVCKNTAGQSSATVSTSVVTGSTGSDPAQPDCVSGLCGSQLIYGSDADIVAGNDQSSSAVYDFTYGALTVCKTAVVVINYHSVFGAGPLLWTWTVWIPYCGVLGPTSSLVAKVTKISAPRHQLTQRLWPWAEDTNAFKYQTDNVGHYTAHIFIQGTITGSIPKQGLSNTKQPYAYVAVDASPRSYIVNWGNP